jgi:hypothetical protein
MEMGVAKGSVAATQLPRSIVSPLASVRGLT